MPPQTPRAEAEVAVSDEDRHEGEPNSMDVHHDEEESVWGELGEGSVWGELGEGSVGDVKLGWPRQG